MKCAKIILFSWLFIQMNVISQEDSKLLYQVILETKLEYNNLDKNSDVNPNNIMNINDFSSISQFYPIIEFKNTYGKVDTKLQAEAVIKNYDLIKDSTDLSFQELYTQFTLNGKHFFIIGKKRLDWGTGIIWNPTNFFIQKDPLRTQNRLEGLFMLNYSTLINSSSLNFYFFPQEKKEDFKFAVKYDFSLNKIDASLSFVEYGKHQQFGYDISYGGSSFTLYSEGVIKNFTKSYRVFDDGSLIYPEIEKKSFKPEIIVGSTILFNSNISFTGEYRFRGDYLNKKEIDLYKRYLPSNMEVYDPISVGKHTIFVNAEYKDTYNRWSANLRSFYDPISDQLVLSPLGTFSQNNFQIEVSTMFYNNSISTHNFQSSILLSCFF